MHPKERLKEELELNPVVAAIHDEVQLAEVLSSDLGIVFLLKGSIFDIVEKVNRIKNSGKMVFVHYDLIEGFSRDVVGLDYLLEIANPDGIISTKATLIKHAQKKGFAAIQRIFLLDSLNMISGIQSVNNNHPDAIEILPGIMHEITAQMVSKVSVPVITGGMITRKEDVINSLKAGALGISSSETNIWKL